MGPRAASPHFRIERLGPGVYAAIASPTGSGLCNAGIVDLGGRTAVFDSMLTPAAGADLAKVAERLTGRRPDWVVNSHWHGDHIWGNSAFLESHVVSSRKVRNLILRKSRRQFEDCRREFSRQLPDLDAPGSPIAPTDRPRVRGWFQGVLDAPRSLRVVPPEVTFERELVLTGSRRSLRLITYGGGHSPSDVFGYLPDERVVFAGDLVMVGLHPSVSDGWPDRWDRILGRVERLRPERVVPGHGEIGSLQAFRRERLYMRELQRVVRRSLRHGESLQELLRTPVPKRYQDWGFTFMFPDNLTRTHRLLSSRKGGARA